MRTKSSVTLRVLLLLSVIPMLARAANLTWDATPSVTGAQDGSGIWDTNTATWWNGSADVLFNNVTPDVPTFGSANGVAGTVTLGTNITSGNIFFNPASVGNYTIAGGTNLLALTNRLIISASSATISAPIVGGSVTISHGPGNAPFGTITLGGTNIFTGGLILGENANNPAGQGAANSTCAARITSGSAVGTGAISYNGQGNATSPRLELVGGITVTNTLNCQGRNNYSMHVESLSGANVLSGPINPSPGGVGYVFSVDGSSSLTLSGLLTVQANGGRTVLLRGSGNGTISGVIAGGTTTSPTNAISKAGSGTWTLSGANPTPSSPCWARAPWRWTIPRRTTASWRTPWSSI
ncbi:MAG: hypothetical protein U1F65_05095 [Verrucomicrobiota bacterium]